MINQAIASDKELEQFGYTPKLHRTLTTWQLTSFGLTYLQPIGPAVVFGYLLTTSHGSVALPYLFAFVGMIFTILSYSVLIKEYPLAGSIYSYIKFIGGEFWGFIAGWILALDYVLIPTITSVSAAIYAHQLVPCISYESWLVTFVLSMGLMNLIGIKATSFFSSSMLLIQIAVVLVGFTIWIYFLANSNGGMRSLFALRPFHFGSITSVIQASSLAIFSFLGFDAVTTLAEESINPRKSIPRAMLLCTIIGFTIMFLTGYLGVLLIPNWENLISDQRWIDATLFNLAKITGGQLFSLIYTLGFILAMIVTNLVGTTAATRLLYGMGRDNKIPLCIFGVVNDKWRTPHGCIIFIVVIELILGSFKNQGQLAELINYGALFGFAMVNLSVIYLGYKLAKEKTKFLLLSVNKKVNYITQLFLFPMVGFGIMLAIFSSMKPVTMIFGTIWGAIGIIYYYLRIAKSKT
jgi:putrescine importer